MLCMDADLQVRDSMNVCSNALNIDTVAELAVASGVLVLVRLGQFQRLTEEMT